MNNTNNIDTEASNTRAKKPEGDQEMIDTSSKSKRKVSFKEIEKFYSKERLPRKRFIDDDDDDDDDDGDDSDKKQIQQQPKPEQIQQQLKPEQK